MKSDDEVRKILEDELKKNDQYHEMMARRRDDYYYGIEERYGPELHEAKLKLKKITEETKSPKDVLYKIFEFPDEYKHICSQYIMWFGEFLKNIGIEANVSTEHKNGQTTLLVEPEKNPELLLQIERYFYQYIGLPSIKLLPPAPNLTQEEMYAYQSAIMQVQHLNTQIQMKDAVIASQNITNFSLISKIKQKEELPLLVESLQEDKKYELFNGAVKIPAIQKFGKNGNIEFDLCKIFNKK